MSEILRKGAEMVQNGSKGAEMEPHHFTFNSSVRKVIILWEVN